MCDLCAKGFFDYEFNSADIDKISNFNEIASNFTYLWTSKFIKYNLTDTDHLLLISKFYGRGKSGMYFCIFGSCQPLKPYLSEQGCQRIDYAKKMQWMYQTSTIWSLRLSPTQGHNLAIHVLHAWMGKTVLLNANFLLCVTPVFVSYEWS